VELADEHRKLDALVGQVECVAWPGGAGAVYWAPSRSQPASFHVVVDLSRLPVKEGEPAQQDWYCDCESFQYRRRCFHVGLVVARRELERLRAGKRLSSDPGARR
jgi:hypothetical protein